MKSVNESELAGQVEQWMSAQAKKWSDALAAYRTAVNQEVAHYRAAYRAKASQRSQDRARMVSQGESLKAAIVHILEAHEARRSNVDVFAAVKAAGHVGHSEATIAAALHRLKKDGTALRFPDGWALAARYPDSVRQKFGQVRHRRKRVARQTEAMA